MILWKAELLFPLPEPRLDWEIPLPYPYNAYTSTSRLSLGLALMVNDIVSFGDESSTAKVTT
jgi:hypothetical protein